MTYVVPLFAKEKNLNELYTNSGGVHSDKRELRAGVRIFTGLESSVSLEMIFPTGRNCPQNS